MGRPSWSDTTSRCCDGSRDTARARWRRLRSRDGVRAQGPPRPQAPHGSHGDCDRPRRRDDQRHLRPHGLDRECLRRDLHAELPGNGRSITGKSAFDLSSSGTTTAPPFDESLLAKVKALPDVKAAIGGVGGEAQLIGTNGKAIVFGGAPNLGLQRRPDAAEVQLPHPRRRPVAEDRRGRGRRVDGGQEGHQDRPADRRAGAGPRRAVPRLGPRQVRRGLHHRRRDARGLRSPDRPAPLRQDGEARPDPRRCEERRLAGRARRGDPPDPAGRHPGEEREHPGGERRGGHEQLHQLPADVPALVRGRCALRRRLRDRELALDHDRAAHPRVRDPAHDRRLEAAGAALGHPRGARDRPRRVGRRPLPRPRPGQGPLQALRRRRLHAAEQRPHVPDPHDRRLAGRRRPRHSRREPPAGLPRHPRASDRGRARGRDPAGGTLPPLSRHRRCGHRAARLRGASLRALRQRPRDDAGPALDGGGRVPHLRRCRALLVAPRRADGPRPRLAGDADRRRSGVARTRQRPAQPATHGLDGCRPHDRPRAGHARRDPGRAASSARSTAPWTTSRAASSTRSRRRTTSLRFRSARRTPRRRPRARVDRERAGRRRTRLRPHEDAHGRRPDDRQGHQPRLEGGIAGGPLAPRRDGRLRRRRFRQEPRPRGRDRSSSCSRRPARRCP